MSKQMDTDQDMAAPLRSTARFRKNGQLTLLATRASGVRLAMRIVAFGIALLIGSEIMCRVTHAAEAAAPPNIVIVFLDDSGWGDFRPFGQPKYDTPHVRKLAEEGRVFKNFYVPQGVCSASRSALLSGCYPGRTKIFGAHAPRARGLDPRFATMGEVLKRQGYATAVFGKWHIGDRPETRPPARGFSESCGLMYSNDMWEFHPEKPKFWGKYPLQFWDNGKVTIERVTPEHQKYLTTWYTEHAVDFIGRHRARPFLLYVPHSMPHVPIYCSDKFQGKSGSGLYGDVMLEIDWSLGQITEALRTHGVDRRTLVVFTSDNGPWISYGNHAGTTPYREAKGTGFDGGIRSACVMKLPGRIPAGTTSEAAFCSVDLLPTIAHLTDATLPKNEIDGRNVWDLIVGKAGAVNPHDYYPFSTGRRFEGVVSGDGRWKLHLPHAYRTLAKAGQDGRPGKYTPQQIGLSLYDLRTDPGETVNVADKHPQVLSKLTALAKEHQRTFYAASR